MASHGPCLKSEFRNPKSEANSKGRKGEKSKTTAGRGGGLDIWALDFRFVSDFGFRVSELGLSRVGGGEWANRVTNPNGTGADNLCKHTLAAVHHQSAQALADGIHLGAGIAWRVELQDGSADFNLLAEQRYEVDACGLDVGADCACWNGGEAEGGGVFGDLLALD